MDFEEFFSCGLNRTICGPRRDPLETHPKPRSRPPPADSSNPPPAPPTGDADGRVAVITLGQLSRIYASTPVKGGVNKIAVLGSGDVGQTLAKGFKAVGHDVIIGARPRQPSPTMRFERDSKERAAFFAEMGVPESNFETAVEGAEVVVLALKGSIAEEVVESLSSALAGKVVLDATNPISGEAKEGIVPYFTAANESLIQRLQKLAPDAKMVKCFNSVGADLLVKPSLKGETPTMFICGDDTDAKISTANLLDQLGWHAEDVGTSAAGHNIEALYQLYFQLWFKESRLRVSEPLALAHSFSSPPKTRLDPRPPSSIPPRGRGGRGLGHGGANSCEGGHCEGGLGVSTGVPRTLGHGLEVSAPSREVASGVASASASSFASANSVAENLARARSAAAVHYSGGGDGGGAPPTAMRVHSWM